jgi:hypothetical protein
LGWLQLLSQIIDIADELIAFHVNGTEGTQKTIDKARRKEVEVKLFSYSIDRDRTQS